MNELYSSCMEQAEQEPGDMTDMKPPYNRHYIAVDERGRITEGWSDGPHPGRDISGAICIDGEGGYQFRLFPGGEENPPLSAQDGVLLYRWDGEEVLPRTEHELMEDRMALIPDLLEAVKDEKLVQLSAACNAAIVAGCGVELPDGSAGHISLTAEDQINLTNAHAAVAAGAQAYPYHLDGGLCELYPAGAVQAMARAATAHKLYHTTYYNHLAAWVRRCKSVEEVSAITYGAALPEDLEEHMEAILGAAGGGLDVV